MHRKLLKNGTSLGWSRLRFKLCPGHLSRYFLSEYLSCIAMSPFSEAQRLPFLPKRKTISDMFSSYIGYDTQTLQWISDRRLAQSLQKHQPEIQSFAVSQNFTEDEVATLRFWIEQLAVCKSNLPVDRHQKVQELAFRHLTAYCEESCYEAVRHLSQKNQQISWDEYLCNARLTIQRRDFLTPLLEKYDAELASLKTYLQKVLINQLRDQLSVGKQSRWRRLYKASDKELREALQNEGIVEPALSQMMFARQQFKPGYLMNKVKNPDRNRQARWPEPDQLDFIEAAKCYNVGRQLPSAPDEVFMSTQDSSADDICRMLEGCITALYRYSYAAIPAASVETLFEDTGYEPTAPSSATEENTVDLLSDALLKQVDQAWSKQVNHLSCEYKQVLLLLYGFGWKQSQIATYLKVNQGTVSRYLTNTKKQLIKTISQLSQPETWIKDAVAGWLRKNCQVSQHPDLIETALVEAFRVLDPTLVDMVKLIYVADMTPQQASGQLGVALEQVDSYLMQIQTQLEQHLLSTIAQWIKSVSQSWLQQHYKEVVDNLGQLMEIPIPLQDNLDSVVQVLDRYFAISTVEGD